MIEELIETFNSVNYYLIVIVVFLVIGYRPPWWQFKTFPWFQKGGKPKRIPGPQPLPILGTQWVLPVKGYKFAELHLYYRDLHRKYGPIVKEEALFNVPVISLFDRADIEKVLKCNGKYPLRPPTEAIAQYRRSRPDRYASTGLVNEQGETWHHLRSSLTPNLTSPKTISSFLPVFHEIADDFCDLLRLTRSSRNLITDLEDTTGRLGLETSCALVLGRRLGFLLPDHESEVAKELARVVHEHFLATRDTYYGLPVWRFVENGAYRRLVRSEEAIWNLATELVRNADDATKESAVFQSVLRADVDEREKTAAIVDFIAAGIHTLKNSLMFLLYMLAEHPQHQHKILEDPTKSYLKACITETFRLLPTANALARITEENLELSGHKIDAGNVVVCHTGVACRDEKNFQNPDEFKPERWLGEEKVRNFGIATYLVVPFGVGRRICPGKRFIEQVLPIIVEQVLRNFEIESVTKLELQFEFLLSPKGPTTMIFKDRS